VKKVLAAAAAAIVLPLVASCAASPSPGGPASSAAPAASSASGSTTGISCTYTADGQASKQVNLPPSSGVSNTGTTAAVLSLNGKAIGLTLDRAKAPCTVNSFVSLATQGFYDDTSCHRMGTAEGFQMLQCGDPTASGRGGPGYRFADELTGSEKYTAGTLAMANSGANTNGSQFFLVFGDTPLDPNYTVFGRIDTAGLKVLMELAAGGTDDSEAQGVGKPKLPAVITSIRVS
jgi:peptidyl-prolyl cis-trans isomerase B (cyclophilin B)